MTKTVSHFFVVLCISFLWAGSLSLFAAEPALESVPPQKGVELIKKNQENPEFVILDVRTPREYEGGHLKDATLMNFYDSDFAKQLDTLDKDKTYFIYCHSGQRSGRTLNLMEKAGFSKVYNLAPGIVGWKKAGLPVVQE